MLFWSTSSRVQRVAGVPAHSSCCMHLRYCCRASTSWRMGDPGGMPAIRRCPKNGHSEMPPLLWALAIGQCSSSKKVALLRSMPTGPERLVRLSCPGLSGGVQASKVAFRYPQGALAAGGVRSLGVLDFSRWMYLLFPNDPRRHRGVIPGPRFSSQESA